MAEKPSYIPRHCKTRTAPAAADIPTKGRKMLSKARKISTFVLSTTGAAVLVTMCATPAFADTATTATSPATAKAGTTKTDGKHAGTDKSANPTTLTGTQTTKTTTKATTVSTPKGSLNIDCHGIGTITGTGLLPDQPVEFKSLDNGFRYFGNMSTDGHGNVTFTNVGFTAPNGPYKPGDTVTLKLVYDNTGLDATAPFSNTIPTSCVANHPPVADSYGINAESGKETPLNIQEHVSDPDNDPVTITIVQGPSHGSIAAVGKAFDYTSNAGYVGLDRITYRATDGKGGSATGTITIRVTPVPTAAQPTVSITPQCACSGQLANVTVKVTNTKDGLGLPASYAVHIVDSQGNGVGQQKGTGVIKDGDSATVTVKLAAGTYQVSVVGSDGSASGNLPFEVKKCQSTGGNTGGSGNGSNGGQHGGNSGGSGSTGSVNTGTSGSSGSKSASSGTLSPSSTSLIGLAANASPARSPASTRALAYTGTGVDTSEALEVAFAAFAVGGLLIRVGRRRRSA